MAEKSTDEAVLSQKEVEQNQLHAELESALSQKSALLSNVKILHGQLVAAEAKLKLTQSSLDKATKSEEQIKALETKLEEAQDQAHKLQLYKLHMEGQQRVNSDTTELDDMKGKIK